MTRTSKEQSVPSPQPSPAEAIVACIALSQAAKTLGPHLDVMKAFIERPAAFNALVKEMPERFPTVLEARKYFVPFFAAGTVFCEVLDEIADAHLQGATHEGFAIEAAE